MDIEVMTDAGRRRQWTVEEKEALLRAAFAPGAIVKVIARQNGISTGLLYSWRRKLWKGRPFLGFSQVVAVPDHAPPPPRAASVIEVEIGRVKVRIPPSMPPALAAAVLDALVKR
jgi:transposase